VLPRNAGERFALRDPKNPKTVKDQNQKTEN
jgi:hypothetical protein